MHVAERGPLDSMEGLYGQNHGWLLGSLRRRLGNSADAADLAHDVFVRLLVRPPAYAFGSVQAARSYLAKMANGMCINLWHRREIEQAWLDTLAAHPEALAPSAEQQAMATEALHAIGRMLLTLPASTARAFVLAVVCERTDQQVADQMGISSRMVRKHVARAMLACMELKAQGQV
ncbi:MAG TPA: sigma-70 family RNA polymerase sigma factor [Pseudorhodoferax sp.]|jgi:RNA polymerase sigma-70 factor (ECF subfamily)|nr:sigma-70 family RNA polymerase sigma factor [Pseudorhodoferax sp.]